MTNSCIAYMEKTFARFPEKTAVIDDKKQYSFKEFRYEALKLATMLATDWLNKPVAILLPKTSDSLVAMMGVLYSGNFYIPLDIKSPDERLIKVLQNLSPQAIITSSEYLKQKSAILNKKSIHIINIDEILNNNHILIPKNSLERSSKIIDTDPIYCIYTSGSTGNPKGVVVPHRAIDDMSRWAVETFSIDEKVIIGNQAPFYFDLSTIDIFLMLRTGATLCLIPQYLFSFPVRLAEYMIDHGINCICWVPSALTIFATHDTLTGSNLRQLERIFFIGEVMPTKTFNYWRKHIPGALYCNMYGPTETTFGSTYYIINREFQDHEPLPIGHPCKNTDILVLSSDNVLVTEDEIGELCIRGSSLALGYWNDDQKTTQTFTSNPLNKNFHELIYRTGDLARYNEFDELCYCGRKDLQIKHAGYRIELGEIEHALSSLKHVDQACVIYNWQKSQITLFYTSSNNEADEVYIRKALSDILPKHMIPTAYNKLDTLPLNPNGKIDRLAIRKQYDHSDE